MNEPSPEAIKAAEEIFAKCVPQGELVGVYEAAKIIDGAITGVVVKILPTYPVPRTLPHGLVDEDAAAMDERLGD